MGHNTLMDTRQAELLNAVDPAELGARIRAARIAGGLTQTELAGGDVSVGYVSRIETGHRRPKASILDSMAERLRVSTDQLLGAASTSSVENVRLELDYAELALETGSAEQARDHAAQAKALAEATGERALVERARLVHARAVENTRDYDEAIIELEDLIEETTDRILRIKAGIALSRCYRESGDLAQAIARAESILAETELAGLGESAEAIQLTVTMAAAHFDRGDLGQAVRVCRRAIAAAERLDSATARAAAYWNASIMESERGATSSAVDLARRALSLLDEQSDARNVARLRSTLGMMQLQLDPPSVDEARETLRQADHELRWSSASAVDLARNDLALAQASMSAGDLSTAMTQAESVHDRTAEIAPVLAAQALGIVGQVLALENRNAEAAAALQRAALLLTGAGSDRDVAQLWYEFAGLQEQLGEPDAALASYRSAAAAAGLQHAPRVGIRV